VVLSFLDITGQKRAEEQVGHAGKLSALGEMASGLAHELNQPLNTIRIGLANITARLRQGEMPADDVLARIERVERNVERAIGVVSHILAFGRREQEAPSLFEASAAVTDACLLAQQELQDAGISLTISAAQAAPLVNGHASLLEQVVLNLLLNARDAILSRREVEPALQGRIAVTLEASDAALVLRVRDNGIGIGPDVAARLFEPFFTSKEIGKGTGLGLSISARIIAEMGGRIGVEPVAEGACFRLDLPVAKAVSPA
jgi:C4-dicarboxylate-specific signal transduction histidine kinase